MIQMITNVPQPVFWHGNKQMFGVFNSTALFILWPLGGTATSSKHNKDILLSPFKVDRVTVVPNSCPFTHLADKEQQQHSFEVMCPSEFKSNIYSPFSAVLICNNCEISSSSSARLIKMVRVNQKYGLRDAKSLWFLLTNQQYANQQLLYKFSIKLHSPVFQNSIVTQLQLVNKHSLC